MLGQAENASTPQKPHREMKSTIQAFMFPTKPASYARSGVQETGPVNSAAARYGKQRVSLAPLSTSCLDYLCFLLQIVELFVRFTGESQGSADCVRGDLAHGSTGAPQEARQEDLEMKIKSSHHKLLVHWLLWGYAWSYRGSRALPGTNLANDRPKRWRGTGYLRRAVEERCAEPHVAVGREIERLTLFGRKNNTHDVRE